MHGDSSFEVALKQMEQHLAAASLLALQLRAAIAETGDGWVSQKGSKLGRNNHIEAVRRRMATGDTERAAQNGKRFLLRKDAYDEELVAPVRRARTITKAGHNEAADTAVLEMDLWRHKLGVKK
jgi:hypothetical protein